jgi:hypothetical protein
MDRARAARYGRSMDAFSIKESIRFWETRSVRSAMAQLERYRNGERIATGLVESTVNQFVSKRMQMAWTERGAHLLLQTRSRVLNGELEETFRRCYPQFRPEPHWS